MKSDPKVIKESIKKIIEEFIKTYHDVEVFYKRGKSSAAFFCHGTDIQDSLSEERGIAVRAWREDGNELFIHTSWDNIERLIKKIREKLLLASFYKKKKIYPPALASKRVPELDQEIFCHDTAEASKKILSENLKEMMASFDKKWNRIIRMNSMELRASHSENILCNSRGFSGYFQRTMASFGGNLQFKIKNNRKADPSFCNNHNFQMIHGNFSLHGLDLPKIFNDFERLQNMGADFSSLRQKDIKEGKYTLIFSPPSSSELLRFFLLKLQEAHTEKSRVPQKFSESLTIVDDGTLKKGLCTSPFDGAGFPSKKTIIVKDGEFINWFENIIRISYRDYPHIEPANLYIKPGSPSQEEIIRATDKGIFIMSLKIFSNHNDLSKISLLGHGLTIERGALSSLAGEFLIREEVKDLFKNILEVGNDLQFFPRLGAYGSPTLLVEKVKVWPIK